ncbi:hypothetical protein BDZ94DRAFT_1312772 [Collybia nuda]|uniref:Uncharacterized protein n=1 Tax=Collybia nuda TaxID=64659 RepID=A0A9P5XYI0_9AGAR|nr:hypothetical protein BDZ94DRAFT_1312772 [Collybia nuda]
MAVLAVLPVAHGTYSPRCRHGLPRTSDQARLQLSTMTEGSSRHHPTRTVSATQGPSQTSFSADAMSELPHNHGSGSYNTCLREDLGQHHVYISFENALQNILHAPEDWQEDEHEYQKIINKVIEDKGFREKRDIYLTLCSNIGVTAHSFHEPLAELYNTGISLINTFGVACHRKEEKDLLRFCVKHPIPVAKGLCTANEELLPDLIEAIKPSEMQTFISWPMIMHVGEMATLDTEGGDPQSEHRSPACKRTKDADADEDEAALTNKKRKISSTQSSLSEGTQVSSQRTSDIEPSKESTASTADSETTNDIPSTNARLRCARYLMEMLEFSALRSHALITLIERDRLQLVYADRSAIVTSSIIDLRTNDGLDKFLAMLTAFHKLSPKQWGLLSLVENPSLAKLYSSKTRVASWFNHAVATGGD